MPVIPDDDPSATHVFTLKDIERALVKHDKLSVTEIDETLAYLRDGARVYLYGGLVLIVPAGIGLFHVHQREGK